MNTNWIEMQPRKKIPEGGKTFRVWRFASFEFEAGFEKITEARRRWLECINPVSRLAFLVPPTAWKNENAKRENSKLETRTWPQLQLLLARFLSLIWHVVPVPRITRTAIPFCTGMSTVTRSLRPPASSASVNMHPLIVIPPIPE